MTISKELIQAYRASRAESNKTDHSRYWPGKAADALRQARAALALQAKRAAMQAKRAALPINLPHYCDDTEETELPGGWLLKIELLPDYDSVPYPIEDAAIEWVSGRYSLPEPFEHGAPDGWLSRDGRTIYGSNDRSKRYTATPGACSGYDFAQYFKDMRARGMARQPAREEARRMAQADADRLNACMNDQCEGIYGVSVTLEDEDGEELGEFSCWGIDDDDYAREMAECEARGLIASAVTELRNSIVHKRNAARGFLHMARALAAEMKEAKGISAPLACGHLKDKLRELRQNHKSMLAQARHASETVKAFGGVA